MAKGDTMRHWLTILFISLTLGLSGQNPRQSITWLRAEDITNTRYFIWRGDTIDFTRFVDSLYVSITDTALFLATKNWVINNTVMMGDSINVYITPKQLRDSLGTLPGGHNPVTISQQGLNNGLSINNDQILTIRAASTSQSGALTSNDYNIFNNKLNAVTHDNTLTGTGTVANPLKVDTSRIASKSWVLNFKFLTQEYRDYDSLYNTPFIPEIKNDPFGVDWQNDVDNGASRNAIYNAITGLGGGGGATNLSYSAYTDKGIVNSDTGTDAEIPAGSTVNASLMLPEDKEFLDTVEDSITAHRIKINSLKLVNIDSSGFRITKNQITDLTVGSSKWDDDTYGITYTGNVGIGGASSAAEKLRVTHNSTNFAVDVYNSSSTGKGLQVRAGGTNHSILDLKNYTGTSRFSFSSNGKAKFSSYGQGNITGTVSKYLAVDSSGNIIEADGTDGGGGDMWMNSTEYSTYINSKDSSNVLVINSQPKIKFVDTDYPNAEFTMSLANDYMTFNYYNGVANYLAGGFDRYGISTYQLKLSNTYSNYQNIDGVIRYDGNDILARIGGVWKSLTAGASGDNWGSQVVVSDATLTGNGTTASPLSVVSSGGMTDPMTTAGDLIYRNSSNVTTRLPRGSNGQVLKATSTGIAWGTDGGSLWTDAGTHTYLSSTTDNLSIGSSSNNGFKLYVDGNGYFTTALHADGFVFGNAFRITEEQSTITGTTGTSGGTFRVGTDNLAYWVSDYNDGNKVYDITGSTKPIKVSGFSRTLYIDEHTFINTSPNPSGLENPIYLPASPHTGKIFVIVNRHTDDVRLRVGTSDVNYYTPSGISNVVAGQSMVTIQFDGTDWYQIQ